MPIQFPPTPMGNPLDRYLWQRGARFPFQQRQPNLFALGKPFTAPLGVPRIQPATLAIVYRDPMAMGAVPSPSSAIGSVNQIGRAGPQAPYTRALGSLRAQLSGVSRDSSGAVLSNCKVMCFRTDDKSFVGETVSDGSGNWILDLMVSGPFFLVEYKAGAPDVAGTSLNTLVTAPV